MIGFMKRLWKDRRGNALIIAGASFPFLVGAAGLATDTIQWAMWKRELQRAADSAAFAGVYAKIQANANMTADQAVNVDLTKNNTTGISLVSGYPQIAYPTGTGYTDAVQVTLAVKKTLGFSSLFMSTAPTIITSATAAYVDEGQYCVVGLSPTGSSLSIGGSSNVTLGCGAISNSFDPTESVEIDGNSHYFQADPVAAAGGITGTVNGSPKLLTYQPPMDDPFDHLSFDIPAGTPCTNFNDSSHWQGGTPLIGGEGGTATLLPGCYTTFNPGNHTYNLEPGVYYLDSTDLTLNGQTNLVGDGVTIILTGNNPGDVSINGTSTIDLSAPTSGPYENMVLMQSPNATVGNNNVINGDNASGLDGGIYFPVGDVQFTGSSTQLTQCAMVVAWTVTFTGSNAMQNSTSGCYANMTVPAKRVRLIA